MENIRWIKNSILRRMDLIIDWMQYYALNLILAAMVFGMLVLMALMAAAILWEPAEAKLHPWVQEQLAREADPEWQAAQARLHRKHGTGHVIIYAPQGAYYHNARGEKCRFM